MRSGSARDHDEGYLLALRQLWERSDYDRGFISNPFAGDDDARLGLRRTAAVLDRLGNPQSRYEIVHIAGSKGKGSTCAFARAILTASGRRTGLYTSPHLHSYRERIAIDGEPVSEHAFAAGWRRVLDAVDAIERNSPALGRVTSFELLTAMALERFAATGCDAAVVEVGLGGTLDATNVVAPVSTAITALDFEHTGVLGSTMAEIATNKAGIVKPGIPLATARLPAEAIPVVAHAIQKANATWLRADLDWSWQGSWRSFDVSGPWGTFRGLRSALIGDHQVDNACLAIAAVWQMLGNALTETAVCVGLAASVWPGRLEVVRHDPLLVLDGAHTPAAAGVLARALAAEFPAQRFTVLLGILRDKDPISIATALTPVAREFLAVAPPSPRALPAAELATALGGLPAPVRVASDLGAALDGARDRPALVTGSLTTVAAAREALGLGPADPVLPP